MKTEKEIKSMIKELKSWLKWAVINEYWADAAIYQAQIRALERVLEDDEK